MVAVSEPPVTHVTRSHRSSLVGLLNTSVFTRWILLMNVHLEAIL
jgi:hypothetical protein